MAKEVVVTHEGYKKLEEELDTLKTVKRSEIAEKIKVARGYGDLSGERGIRCRQGRAGCG